MDDDNWDLHAVVRGYAAASASAAAAANNTIFPSFSTADQNSSFDFLLTGDGNFNGDPFQGLHEAYRELCGGGDVAPPPPASTVSFPAAAAHNVFHQPRQEMMQMLMTPPNNYIHMNNIEFNNPRLGSTSSHNSPAINPQPNNRQRRRKNQQIKIVREMTQEDLSADSWAWRKYGQKPIKGSPYPRNYYRCSTSKGCAARKQVERSPNDAGLFVVSYTGEHTHPRPTHRSSLAGSTRSKLSSPRCTSAVKNNNNIIINNNNKGNLNICSSSASAAGFTPSTPVAADVEMAEELDDGEEENNIFMIHNDDDDDLFKVFHDSDDHSSGGGGDMFTGGILSSPPWTPTGSATFRG